MDTAQVRKYSLMDAIRDDRYGGPEALRLATEYLCHVGLMPLSLDEVAAVYQQTLLFVNHWSTGPTANVPNERKRRAQIFMDRYCGLLAEYAVAKAFGHDFLAGWWQSRYQAALTPDLPQGPSDFGGVNLNAKGRKRIRWWHPMFHDFSVPKAECDEERHKGFGLIHCVVDFMPAATLLPSFDKFIEELEALDKVLRGNPMPFNVYIIGVCNVSMTGPLPPGHPFWFTGDGSPKAYLQSWKMNPINWVDFKKAGGATVYHTDTECNQLGPIC